MSKLKITIELKKELKSDTKETREPCKHELGGMYTNIKHNRVYLVVNNGPTRYGLLSLNFMIVGNSYASLDEIDANNTHDIPVDAELIIREVQ